MSNACGGGGGGGGDSLPGIYDIRRVEIEDDCGVNSSAVANFVDEVNQLDEMIALQRGRLNYAGQVSENGGFTVTTRFVASNGCVLDSAIAYVPTEEDDYDFGVGEISDASCPGSSLVCRVAWAGTAVKR